MPKSKSLKPCKSHQYRDPATNRCKNKSSSAKKSNARKSKSYKPCKSHQYRDPATNRCRNKSTSAKKSSAKKSSTKKSKSLKPCKSHQYRDPATNRCRNKSTSAKKSSAKKSSVKKSSAKKSSVKKSSVKKSSAKKSSVKKSSVKKSSVKKSSVKKSKSFRLCKSHEIRDSYSNICINKETYQKNMGLIKMIFENMKIKLEKMSSEEILNLLSNFIVDKFGKETIIESSNWESLLHKLKIITKEKEIKQKNDVLKYISTVYDSGKMKLRTCFSSISHSGYKIDILKSALQKYLRRREYDKMLWCCSELYLFHALDTDKQKKASKGIITNMLNRLIIMMDEEMLFAEVGKYMKCMKWIEEFEEGGRNNFIFLIKICKTMINSRMLRLNSDINSYWWKGVNIYKVVKVPNLTISNEAQKELKEILGDKEKGDAWKNERKNLLMFINAFRKKHDSCYYWALSMFHSNIKGNTRFRRTDCVYAIWEYLFKVAGNNKKIVKCLKMKLEQFFVKNRSERHIWLSSSISIMLHKNNINFDEKWNIDVNKEEAINIFKNRKFLKIDDYAIDMHCSSGRKLGKVGKDFALEGSLVVNEDKQYYNESWRKLYNDLKVNPEKYKIGINKVEKETEFVDEKEMEFIDGTNIKEKEIRICMNKTCGNKVMSFEYKGKIWKEAREGFDYNKDYELVDNCKEIFGLKKIGMKRIKSNFKIEKINKKISEWTGNWRKVMTDKKIVYSLMNKIGDGVNFSENKDKLKLLENKEVAKEIAKIAMFRGLFRVTDFNLRNILVSDDGSLVSIDENDIGKRTSIFGNREKWLKKYLTVDIIKEAYKDISFNWKNKLEKLEKNIKKFGYTEKTLILIVNNYNNLQKDLKSEGFL